MQTVSEWKQNKAGTSTINVGLQSVSDWKNTPISRASKIATLRQDVAQAEVDANKGFQLSDIAKGVYGLYSPLVKRIAPTYTQPFKIAYERGKEFIAGLTSEEKTAETVAKGVQTLTAGVSTLFTPITAVFEEASKVPVLKEAAQIISMPFEAGGIVGSFAADRFVDVLPIGKENRDILRSSFEEAGSLLGMIWIGGKVMKTLTKGESLTKEKITEFKEEAKVVPKTLEVIEKQQVAEQPVKMSVKEWKEQGKPAEPLQEAKILRGTKGMTADDIMAKYPNIKLTKDVPAKDIYGNKIEIPKGETLTPYELKGNKILLQDGDTYIVSKNQFQNIKGQSVIAEAKEFAPELKGLEESVRGETPKIVFGENNLNRISQERYGINWTELTPNKQALVKKIAEERHTTGATKFSSYQLPGGKNYKEILIKAKPETFEGVKMQDLTDTQLAKINEQGFKSSHWDEPNVISHLRLNERAYQGKKVTFMEELQSDWAREVRKNVGSQDFNVANKNLDDYVKILTDKYSAEKWSDVMKKATNEEFTKWSQLNEAVNNSTKVPNNPLLKNWQELSIKRALKEAVDNKSDYFSWINGEQTSARYNLATHINEAKWKTGSDGVRKISLNVKEGGQLSDFVVEKDGTMSYPMGYAGKKLDEVLGKGLADSIMAKPSGTLSGEGLKFGGEWATNLYDKQIKNIVEDVTGGKVVKLDMGLPIEKSAERWITPARGGLPTRMIKPEDLKVGKEIEKVNAGGALIDAKYIITDILGDGKFKAVPKEVWVRRVEGKIKGEKAGDYQGMPNWKDKKETFDISTKTTTQQGIKLTPEIKAKIREEAPKIKTSGEQFAPEVPIGKPSGVAKSIEAKAIEQGLIDKGFDKLAEYEPAVIKEQSQIMSDIMKTDIERAKRLAKGQEVLPERLKGATALQAMEDYAMETKDGQLALDLANSPIATEISVAGQTLRLSAERTPDSATAKIKEIQKERQKAVEKKLKGKDTTKVKAEIKRSLKEKMDKSKPNKYDLASLLDKIVC